MTKDERAGTIGGMIMALTIIASHSKNGLKTEDVFTAEHDIIYVALDKDELSSDSEDGRLLQRLGFHLRGDGWAYFT